MLGSTQKCLGAYFSKAYEHGQKAGPINGPASNWVGTQFCFDSLCILAVAVLSTVADWSLLRVGNWTHFNCPSQHDERVRCSVDSYLEELRAGTGRNSN